MTEDLMERLRAANPVRHGSAPPVDHVRALIDADAHGPAPRAGSSGRTRSRTAWLSGLLGPGLALGGTIGVVAAVIVIVGHHHDRPGAAAARPGSTATATTTSTPPTSTAPDLDPPGGARGEIFVSSPYPTAGGIMIPYQQDPPAHAGTRTHGVVPRYWMVESSHGGRRWHVTRAVRSALAVSFAGSDGWMRGLQYEANGTGVVRFLVSHDGGRHWSVASAAAPPSNYGGMSIAGGEVWTLGSPGDQNVVLHGRASGDALTATAAQPPTHDSTNVSVIGVNATTAYVFSDSLPMGEWRTTDAGRSWHRLSDPCPRGDQGGPSNTVMSTPGSRLWSICTHFSGSGRHTHARTTVTRSTNGGDGQWLQVPLPSGSFDSLQPISATTAWLLMANGRVLRTIDGGRVWRLMYSVTVTPGFAGADTPILMAQSAHSATVITVLTRGHTTATRRTNLLVATTTGGNWTWGEEPVRLPAG